MAKHLDSSKGKPSPFDALKIAQLRKPAPESNPELASQPHSQTFSQPQPAPTKTLAKSIDPAYIKFTTYIRKDTHRALKLSLVAQEREMSDLVEELLVEWLRRNSFKQTS